MRKSRPGRCRLVSPLRREQYAADDAQGDVLGFRRRADGIAGCCVAGPEVERRLHHRIRHRGERAEARGVEGWLHAPAPPAPQCAFGCQQPIADDGAQVTIDAAARVAVGPGDQNLPCQIRPAKGNDAMRTDTQRDDAAMGLKCGDREAVRCGGHGREVAKDPTGRQNRHLGRCGRTRCSGGRCDHSSCRMQKYSYIARKSASGNGTKLHLFRGFCTQASALASVRPISKGQTCQRGSPNWRVASALG
jgi:hypothetical protein